MKQIIFFLTIVSSTPSVAQKFLTFYPTNNVGWGFDSTIDDTLLFVCNGPLVGTDLRPVGGYVDAGAQKKPWVDPKMPIFKNTNFEYNNGIFGQTKDGGMIALRYDEWRQRPRVLRWGFQNGGLLLQNGINLCNPNSTNLNIRSGIGYRADGELIVLISQENVTFWELAEYFLSKKCIGAIYLDGSSTYVFFAAKGISQGDQEALKLQFFWK